MSAHGILNLNKPPGATSMAMVRLVKRITGQRKVGHGGTLDPMASGVLPILLGQATHMMDYLIEGTKTYRARILLGITTDTLDAMGAVVGRGDPSAVTRAAVEEALEAFRGTIAQVPPMHSALKRGGERLYALARAGVEVPRESRTVQVFRLELLEWEPPSLTVDVECGRGVYIRALADDLGQALGCGGHLTALERQRTGPFSLASSITPEQLTETAETQGWQELLLAPDVVVEHLWAAVVNHHLEAYLRQGRQVALGWRGQTPAQHQELCRVYSLDGRFLALARFDRPLGLWQPTRVFDQSASDERSPRGNKGAPQRGAPPRRSPGPRTPDPRPAMPSSAPQTP